MAGTIARACTSKHGHCTREIKYPLFRVAPWPCTDPTPSFPQVRTENGDSACWGNAAALDKATWSKPFASDGNLVGLRVLAALGADAGDAAEQGQITR